jgi:hypothetical protein
MDRCFGRYAQREFERRWLLRRLPAELHDRTPDVHIVDWYLAGTRFRLRERTLLATDARVWKLTQKFPCEPGAFDHIVITNNYLTRAEYGVFRKLPGAEIVKRAWLIDDAAGRRYGVHAFEGGLADLILAECEYSTHEQLLASPPPPFEGVEVTMKREFTGGELIGKRFDDVKHLVEAAFISR